MYLAKPTTPNASGVLVLHSWWGLNAFFRSLCDRLAGAGFVALGVDLFDGRVAQTIPEARELRAKVSAARREPAYRYLIRMIGELQAASSGELSLLGCSMGGHWAYWLSQRPDLDIAKTVTFYSARTGDYAKSRCAFLAHFAEDDDFVSKTAMRRLEHSMSDAGCQYQSHLYAGTSHWFFESDRPEYDKPSAELAWQRTVEFLSASV